jgi:hypothetical protein
MVTLDGGLQTRRRCYSSARRPGPATIQVGVLPETGVAEWLQKEVLAPASDLVLHAAGLVTLTAAGLASGITNDKDNE